MTLCRFINHFIIIIIIIIIINGQRQLLAILFTNKPTRIQSICWLVNSMIEWLQTGQFAEMWDGHLSEL